MFYNSKLNLIAWVVQRINIREQNPNSDILGNIIALNIGKLCPFAQPKEYVLEIKRIDYFLKI